MVKYLRFDLLILWVTLMHEAKGGEPTIQQIVERYISARGGIEKIKAILENGAGHSNLWEKR